jgi:hypothetical protein
MLIENVDIAPVTVEKRDRNFRIEIYADLEYAPDYRVIVHREVVLVKDGKRYTTGADNGERVYEIEKRLSELAGVSVTLPPEFGGLTLNGAQIAAAMEMISDVLASQV